MDALHPQLDHGVSLDELNAQVDALVDAVPTLTDDELLAGVMRTVAMVSRDGCDAHTGAYVWGGERYPLDSLPLRLWLFDDGVYVVDALAPYRELIGSRVDAIADAPTADVIDLLDPLVPRDNQQTVRLLLPRFLLIPQILRGVGLDTGESVRVELSDDDGAAQTVDIAPIPMADYNEWAGAYGLHIPADPTVPYLARIDDLLWWRPLDDATLFVQYNQIEATDLDGLRTAIQNAGIHEVVLDLRHNFGGEVSAVAPMVTLFSDWAGPGRKLDVVTGRNTFSAASLLVARLVAEAAATVVGEPMGGCPSAWGNTHEFTLPYSGIPISVATIFEVGVSADDRRSTIEPDVPAPLTVEQWRGGRDPALEALGFDSR
jgi:hypothetical protein